MTPEQDMTFYESLAMKTMFILSLECFLLSVFLIPLFLSEILVLAMLKKA